MNITDFITTNYIVKRNIDVVSGWEVNGEKLTPANAKSIVDEYNSSKEEDEATVNADDVISAVKIICKDKNRCYSKKKSKEDEKKNNRQRKIDNRAEGAEWMKDLEYSSSGNILNNHTNVEIYMFCSDDYKGRFKYNEYTECVELDGRELDDTAVSVLYGNVDKRLGFKARDIIDDTVSSIPSMKEITYHPVKEYLKSLIWDGTPRLDTMLIDWFGAEDNTYVREAARKWMLGAIKRIFQPGCKFDFMLMLTGGTGIGKSTFCERLARVGGYLETQFDINSPKDYIPLFRNNWIVAFDERGSLSKKDNNDAKSFLSRREDKARLAYGRKQTTYLRHNAFISTTNDDRFLNDYSVSEERRYWTIKCNATSKTNIYDNFTPEIVDQIWAEVYYYYKDNPNVDISLSSEAYKIFIDDQKQFKTIADDQSRLILEEKLNVRSWDVTDVVDSEVFVNIVTNPNLHAGDKQFDIVPVSCINYYLNTLKIPFAPAKLKMVMEDLGWVKEKCNVFIGEKKTTMQCFRRKTSRIQTLRLPESPTPTVRRAYDENPLI